MVYYTDEILNCLCKWCNLKKTITRSKCLEHKLVVGQIEGGICFDCYKIWNKDEIICEECISVVNTNHPFSYEYIGYINNSTDYDFFGNFSFCRECLIRRGYMPNIEHIIQHYKTEYINKMLDNFGGLS